MKRADVQGFGEFRGDRRCGEISSAKNNEMFGAVRRLSENELVPKSKAWNRRRQERSRKLCADGRGRLPRANAPAEYGGAGADSFTTAIVVEELSRVRPRTDDGLAFDIIMPYIRDLEPTEPKAPFPGACDQRRDDLAIAMTEPGRAPTSQAVQTTARREGDNYVINGSRCSSRTGRFADAIVVVVKTDTKAFPRIKRQFDSSWKATSPGFHARAQASTARFKGQDTQRAVLRDSGLPVTNLLDARAAASRCLMEKLQAGTIGGRRSGALTRPAMVSRYESSTRRAGVPSGRRFRHFKNTQFKLAEMETEVENRQPSSIGYL